MIRRWTQIPCRPSAAGSTLQVMGAGPRGQLALMSDLIQEHLL